MPRDESSKNAANKNGSTPTTPTSPNSTKFCHVIKRPDFDGYGFNLHTEKVKPGQYIGKIDAGSPAEAAGLKEGDRIIEVNGVNIAQESHKQVVQRIKAIANEVRLLLIDVDGVGNVNVPTAAASATKTTASSNSQPIANTNGNTNGSSETNGNTEYQGIVQEMPGASANISSISMKSTKRSSSASGSESSSPRHSNSKDVPDRAGIAAADVLNSHTNDNNNMMNKMSTPPPPSAAIATVPITPPPPKAQSASSTINTAVTNSNGGAANVNANANSSASASVKPIQPAGLQLQMTAAEMRAKLMARKKYDPKNENVDLRKKFEIIQKL